MLKKIKEKMNKQFSKFWRYLHKVKYFYLIGSWRLWVGKKQGTLWSLWGRCREVCADPNNKYIPRVRDAGRIIDRNLIMHNGIKVKMGQFAYYGDFANTVLKTNKGVHEPQEERMFMEVLKFMPKGATIIELGAYWGFYSMWFKKEVKNAHCYMIEPEEKFIACGKENFKLNNMTGTFIKGKVGDDGIKIDNFIKEKGIDIVHILHSDIQGSELNMLKSCKEAILKNKIWYFFISTHSQQLHYDCMSFLKDNGYLIIASADFDFGTYCCDGVLVARLKKIKGLNPVEISLRRKNHPI